MSFDGYKPRKVDAVEILTDLEGKEIQHDIKKCCHCGGYWRKRPGSGIQRGFCYKCMNDFCGPQCAECVPFEKQLEIEEEKAKRLLETQEWHSSTSTTIPLLGKSNPTQKTTILLSTDLKKD